ncbi:MAG: glycerol-3-phosphate 1-O-acyltransferase PlsY [Hyphomonadaceae bacterium]
MIDTWGQLYALLGGYLLGSIPFGLVLTRLGGLGDIREIGSGNIGATNVLRTGRKDLALATLLLDAGKAGLAVLIVMWVAPGQYPAAMWSEIGYLGLLAGAAAFVGHCFPVWLKFKGGKGVATFIGLMLASMWQVGLAFAAVWILTALVFRMSSLAALVATLAAPIMVWYLEPNGESWKVVAFLALIIYWRHRENIVRIATGKESKIGNKKDAPAPDAGKSAG